MRVHRPVPLIFIGLFVAVPFAIAGPAPLHDQVIAGEVSAPAPKAPEVTTIGQAPGVLTPLEIAKIEALARAYPFLGIRVPASYTPPETFQTPIVRIEHFAPGSRKAELSTRAPSVGPRDRRKAVIQAPNAATSAPRNGAPQARKGDGR
jgi:hypothetical protein